MLVFEKMAPIVDQLFILVILFLQTAPDYTGLPEKIRTIRDYLRFR